MQFFGDWTTVVAPPIKDSGIMIDRRMNERLKPIKDFPSICCAK